MSSDESGDGSIVRGSKPEEPTTWLDLVIALIAWASLAILFSWFMNVTGCGKLFEGGADDIFYY